MLRYTRCDVIVILLGKKEEEEKKRKKELSINESPVVQPLGDVWNS